MIPFGEWVTLHRKLKGLSQAELARRSGIDRRTIWAMEAGQQETQLQRAVSIITKGFGLQPWEAFFYMEKCDPSNYQPEEV